MRKASPSLSRERRPIHRPRFAKSDYELGEMINDNPQFSRAIPGPYQIKIRNLLKVPNLVLYSFKKLFKR
jgi:hypothetical protein